MSDNRVAIRAIIDSALDDPDGDPGFAADNIIDALRAEGWSIVRLRRVPSPDPRDSYLYVITEGEA